MTEAEWLACDDSVALIAWLTRPGSPVRAQQRRLSLFDAACCRGVWHLLTDPRSRHAVETVERFVDGAATDQEREAAFADAGQACAAAYLACRNAGFADSGPLHNELHASGAVHVAASCGRADEWYRFGGTARVVLRLFPDSSPEQARQVALVRDIFGNPFRPVALDPAWRTSDVLALAKGIYDQRAFDLLPILADALQDAGCTSDDVLNHCRDAHATHVRGCWVLDLLLGKG